MRLVACPREDDCMSRPAVIMHLHGTARALGAILLATCEELDNLLAA